jgi:cell wall-associated NlpC family hydrolase
MTPDTYINEVRTWDGTPFAHKGHTKGLAVDCIGLVYGSALALGLISGLLPDYAKTPQGNLLEQSLREHPALFEVSTPEAGSIVLFKFASFGQHVGIFTGRNLIHSFQPLGGYKEHRYCDKWKSRKVSAFSFKALA